MRALFSRAIWVWVIFFVLAVLNGLLREVVYVPSWGELWGRVAGIVILLLAMLIVMHVFLRRNAGSLTRMRLVLLGLWWLGLSLFFEFAVSHWVMEEPWEAILAHYNVWAVRLRVLVRLVELGGPIVLGGRILARHAGAGEAMDEASVPAETTEEG